MIQMNLLPDVKMEYLKAERSRRLVITISTLVIIASVGLLVLLLFFGAVQKKNLADLNNDIRTETSKLKEQPGISKVLTVQNQLSALTRLHDSKPASDRVFGFLNQVTPVQASINSFIIDFTTNEITITGTADSLSSVNKFIDTLKLTKYSDQGNNKKAFSDVVLTSFSVNGGSTQANQQITYSVKLKYSPDIFGNTKAIKLNVPAQSSTRSQLDSGGDLFQTAPQSQGAPKR